MSKYHTWSDLPVVQDLGPVPVAVKSAARAFRIIEFFDEIRRSARANEIADRLGYPQSSTSKLLGSLVLLGYLDFNPVSRTYLPSLRTAVLATWRDTGCFRDGSMLATLERLARRTGLAGCLSARTGIFTRYLHVVQAPNPGDVHITLSARRYAVQSAAGIVLLAQLDDQQVKSVVHMTHAERDPMLQGLSLALVMERVEKARAKGCFLSAGLVTPGSGAVAMALPGAVTGGWQEMALSVAGQRLHIEPREVELEQALDAAMQELAAENTR